MYLFIELLVCVHAKYELYDPINVSAASYTAHGIKTGDGGQKSEPAKLGSKSELSLQGVQ